MAKIKGEIMKVRLFYALAAVIVFAIEICIALYIHDALIRPYIGDSLAVVLIYLALRALTPWHVAPVLIITLSIAAAIEFGQLFHLITMIGLEHSRAARFVLGGSFDGKDFICYAAGAICVLVAEVARKARLI